jgi:hypothetical protein
LNEFLARHEFNRGSFQQSFGSRDTHATTKLVWRLRSTPSRTTRKNVQLPKPSSAGFCPRPWAD